MSPFLLLFFFFLLFLPQTSTHSCHKPISSSIGNRRVLHQPLFPLPTVSPPSPSPSFPPSSPPISFPKYPFSTNPSTFFPFFTPPSLPPPSTTTTTATPVLPTYPANITSLILPTSQNVHKKSSTAKKIAVVVAIVIPVISVTVLGSVCFFLIYRRQRRSCLQLPEKSVISDNRRLFPPNTRTSDGRKVSGGASTTTTDITSSDFLYLGTVVNSRSGGGGGNDTTTLDGTSGGGGSVRVSSPYRKLGSPELRPLPPLSKHSGIVYVNAEGGCSSDEEYYSPRESAVEKEKGRLCGDTAFDGSQRVLSPPLDKLQSQMPDMSSSSYPSSNSISSPTPPSSPSPRSSPQLSSSLCRSSPQSPSFGSENLTVLKDNATVGPCHPPPPPPPPPPPLLQQPIRPLTPSPLLSPPESGFDLNLKIPNLSGQNLMIDKEVRRNTLFTGPPLSAPPPSRPPPLPPLGYLESKSPKVVELPSLVPPRPIGVKTSTPSSFFPADSPRNSSDTGRKNVETPRPKLKPLHWDKVRASSDCAMVWDQLRSSSFQLNEEMIETLFGCDPANNAPMGMGKRQVPLRTSQNNQVLDPKKSQNIAILLRALNVTKEEVCEALLEGNTDSLGAELLETLLKMAPSKEEEINLKEHKDDTTTFKLGPAEKFLKAVLDIPFAFKRVDAMLYATNFDSEVSYLKKSFETIETACEELRKNRMFMKLLEAVLKTGNRMNVGTDRGDAQAFKLDTLLKLVDVKGTDGKTTLLHFVVQEIIRAEGSRLSVAKQTCQSNGEPQMCSLRDDLEFKKLGLQVVAGLSGELSNVKKAAAMDSDVLSSYVSKLAAGIGKVSEVIRLSSTNGCSEKSSWMFQESMSVFLKKAEYEIIKIQSLENAALLLVREITEYFHGNSAREEAHPFRIFMVVRDFLSILDLVCKEVGKINDRSSVSSARQFPVPANTTHPLIFPVFQSHQRASGSSEEEEDTSSCSS